MESIYISCIAQILDTVAQNPGRTSCVVADIDWDERGRWNPRHVLEALYDYAEVRFGNSFTISVATQKEEEEGIFFRMEGMRFRLSFFRKRDLDEDTSNTLRSFLKFLSNCQWDYIQLCGDEEEKQLSQQLFKIFLQCNFQCKRLLLSKLSIDGNEEYPMLHDTGRKMISLDKIDYIPCQGNLEDESLHHSPLFNILGAHTSLRILVWGPDTRNGAASQSLMADILSQFVHYHWKNLTFVRLQLESTAAIPPVATRFLALCCRESIRAKLEVVHKGRRPWMETEGMMQMVANDAPGYYISTICHRRIVLLSRMLDGDEGKSLKTRWLLNFPGHNFARQVLPLILDAASLGVLGHCIHVPDIDVRNDVDLYTRRKDIEDVLREARFRFRLVFDNPRIYGTGNYDHITLPFFRSDHIQMRAAEKIKDQGYPKVFSFFLCDPTWGKDLESVHLLLSENMDSLVACLKGRKLDSNIASKNMSMGG